MKKGIAAAIMVPHPPLIVPEVGRGGEKQIAKTDRAYREAAGRLAACKPETIVVISPHQTLYADYFHISPGKRAAGSFAAYGAAQVRFEENYDTEFVSLLLEEAEAAKIPAGPLGEREPALDHGTMTPLYFIRPYWKDYRLVRIGLSGLSLLTHYELGRCIQRAAERSGKRVALVGSGDLSHRLKEDGPYGFRQEGPLYDERIMDVMGRAAFGELFDFSERLLDGAGECGHRSFVIMAGALDGLAVEAERLSYEGVTGVGYGVCTYEVTGVDAGRDFGRQQAEKEAERMRKRRAGEDAYVRFARSVLETYIGEGRKPKVPENLPRELYERRAGAFVSIKKEGRLRGCIGTIGPVRDTLAEEILENAISAGTADPRFPPIEKEELERLTISVDVLGEPEEVDSPAMLDASRYGVIVSRGARRGLLLPDLEGVDTVEEQIRIARQKAGIRESEEVRMQRFEVVRHH